MSIRKSEWADREKSRLACVYGSVRLLSNASTKTCGSMFIHGLGFLCIRRKEIFASLLALGATATSTSAFAQSGPPNVAKEYAKQLQARSDVGPLDPASMFGDRVGLYMGSLEFLQTDVSIPGNNGLDVSIKRRLVAGSQGSQGLFRDWDLAVPSVHGIYSQQGGWNTRLGSDSSRRCSSFQAPRSETVVRSTGGGNLSERFEGEEFWHGVFLYLPETGDENVLMYPSNLEGINWQKPETGYDYPLRTKSGTAIRCISSDADKGEAFEVTTPQGVTYTLNHMVDIMQPPIVKFRNVTLCDFCGPTTIDFVLHRRKYVFLPTSARDNFGNTLNYTWVGRQLTRIEASDGRALNITYITPIRDLDLVSEVKYGGKIWKYSYGDSISHLASITLPDQSSWKFTPSLVTTSEGYGSTPAENVDCSTRGLPTTSWTGTMTHPSGAIASFTISPVLHGRSYSSYSCTLGFPMPGNAYNGSYETFPAKYYLWSITNKRLVGPGMQTPLSWTYTYGPDNGCYSVGGTRDVCAAGAPSTRWIDVKEPSGVISRYTFGNRWNSLEEGQLLSLSKPGLTISNVYNLDTQGAYPWTAGWSAAPARGMSHTAAAIVPLRYRVVEQDGRRFVWQVDSSCGADAAKLCFDRHARPTKVRKASEALP